MKKSVQFFEPTNWWRVIDSEGKLWCETSSESEARKRKRKGDVLQRMHRQVQIKWITEE